MVALFEGADLGVPVEQASGQPNFQLPPEDMNVYAHLVRSAPTSVADVLHALPDSNRVPACLDWLTDLGLIWCDASGLLHVAPPRAAAEAWAARQELEAARAREAATVLGDMYAAERPINSRPVELLIGAALTLQTFEDLILSAQTEIRGFDRGPYLTTAPTERDDVQLEAMARGVSYRVIYEASVLGDEHNMRTLRASVAAGELARAFPELPMKLVIFDSRTALIPAHRADGSDVDALVVHPSPMLDALVEVHEAFWRLSAPIHAETSPDTNAQDSDSLTEPSTQTNHLLALLTAGLTDESIARMIGISERTVSRRVSRLQELLGARTRFQLGVQASRRGWI